MSDGPAMLTPTEQRIMDLLGDGMPHTKKEMVSCLADPMGGEDNVKPHLHGLRKKLLAKNETVLCVLVDRRVKYRWVALRIPPLTLGVKHPKTLLEVLGSEVKVSVAVQDQGDPSPQNSLPL